jgi:hypothetical protein
MSFRPIILTVGSSKRSAMMPVGHADMIVVRVSWNSEGAEALINPASCGRHLHLRAASTEGKTNDN